MSQPDNNNETPPRPSSTADNLLQQQRDRDERAGMSEQQYEDYKKALNGVASTPNGQFVLKTFIKALGVFTVKPTREGVALVSDKALRDFYLTMIRPHLDPTIRQDLET
jgi:hypothetical protein